MVAPVNNAISIEVVIWLDIEALTGGVTIDAQVEEVCHSLQQFGLRNIDICDIGKRQLLTIAHRATKDWRHATPRMKRHLLTLDSTSKEDVVEALGRGGGQLLVWRTHIYLDTSCTCLLNIPLVECPVAIILHIETTSRSHNPQHCALAIATLKVHGGDICGNRAKAIEHITTLRVIVEDEEFVLQARVDIATHILKGVLQHNLHIAIIGEMQLREAPQPLR